MSHNYLEVSPDGHGGLLIRCDAATAEQIAWSFDTLAIDKPISLKWLKDCAFNIRSALSRFKIPASG